MAVVECTVVAAGMPAVVPMALASLLITPAAIGTPAVMSLREALPSAEGVVMEADGAAVDMDPVLEGELRLILTEAFLMRV